MYIMYAPCSCLFWLQKYQSLFLHFQNTRTKEEFFVQTATSELNLNLTEIAEVKIDSSLFVTNYCTACLLYLKLFLYRLSKLLFINYSCNIRLLIFHFYVNSR